MFSDSINPTIISRYKKKKCFKFNIEFTEIDPTYHPCLALVYRFWNLLTTIAIPIVGTCKLNRWNQGLLDDLDATLYTQSHDTKFLLVFLLV